MESMAIELEGLGSKRVCQRIADGWSHKAAVVCTGVMKHKVIMYYNEKSADQRAEASEYWNEAQLIKNNAINGTLK